MDNEATRLINDETVKKEQTASAPKPETTESKKSIRNNPIATAAGGFVAGAAVGAGTTAAATNVSGGEPEHEGVNADDNAEIETPAPEQVILANDEGIRYAHVEADNFSDAFAQARAQVGSGGVFEYNGKLYNTFIAEEWNEMSAEERADYQRRVNDIAPSRHAVSHDSHKAETAELHETTTEAIPTNAEMISAEPVDNEIRVLGVDAVQNEDGQIMNVALVECEDDQALLVDVDNNGTIDVLLHDDNGNGQLQESEVHDISEAEIEVADLLQAQAAQEGDILYSSNDDMPDYVNDADSIMTI